MMDAFFIGAAVIGLIAVAVITVGGWIIATGPLDEPEAEPIGMAEKPRPLRTTYKVTP
jgi:hypothetical protein